MGVKEQKEQTSCVSTQRCRWVCSVITLGLALLFLTVGLWFTHLHARLTPVYTAVSCKFQGASLEDASLSSGLEVLLKIEVTCTNPNPYSIRIVDSKRSKVFIGDQTTEVGSLLKLPPSSLPSMGTGSIHAYNSVTVSPALLTTLTSLLISDIPIKLGLDLDVLIDVSFIFGAFKTMQPFKKDCGMNLAGVPTLIFNPNGARIGPMACAKSFDDLVIPAVNAEATSDGAMDFVGINIAPEEIAKGKEEKDLGLGIAMGVNYFLSFFFLIITLCTLFGHRCSCRRKPTAEPAGIAGVDEINTV